MRRRRERASRPEPEPLTAPPDTDQAWKSLSLVNDWVKHAEAKLGVTLAATGVSGGLLFNLVKDRGDTTWAFNVAAAVCCVAVFVAGVCAMIGLYPVVRLRQRTADEAINPLFFHDIATAYKGDAPSYSAVLHTLTTNPDDLVRHLSQQVHANATVAQRKYRWANRAIRALLLDLLMLGAVATIIALKW
ncbi:MAG: DUF5706 domain-containing protein [Candidatus Nanopelagicales bacterium]|nr:DUF5706 domain-containing protein [Candidatus Nanopelagicales bacterium]MCU0294686.1 DUF5706 domain-containing protein [Candidatus Nanopelagicales bacterium]